MEKLKSKDEFIVRTKSENRVLNGLLICLLSRSPKCRMADDATQVMAMKRAQGFRIEIPDYAIDSHVEKGTGRHYRHWVDVGSKCANLISEDDLGGPSYKTDAESMYEELANLHHEPRFDDPDVIAKGLR